MSKSLIHISDLHFGKPYRTQVGEAVLEHIRDLTPDAVVCSGDLVQFAEHQQSWREARAWFDKIHRPLLVIPGNHDAIRFLPIGRWYKPLRHYFDYISAERDSSLHIPGISIVGLGTIRSWTLELGYITKAQLRWLEREFAQTSPDTFRIAVQHQAAMPKSWFGVVRTHVRGHERAVRSYGRAGVDLILTGHNHFCHEQPIERCGKTMLWSQVGTTTSNRFPPIYPRRNYFKRFIIDPKTFDVETWEYDEQVRAFSSVKRTTFQKHAHSPGVSHRFHAA